MKRFIQNIIPAAALTLLFGMTSCTKDLDVTPIDPNLSLEVDYDGLFNKCYANLGLQGNGGANGDCDIDGLDGGTTGFIRQMWNSNELTTDEAICSWGDDGIQQFDYNNYDASHPMLNGYFNRLTTGISYCNQYIQVAGDRDAQKTAEIRFIRALHYYLMMDAFGGVPFAESLSVPSYKSRSEIFAWLEQELLAIEPALAAANAKEPDLLVTWLFRLTNENASYNIASVIGIIVFIACATFTLISFGIMMRGNKEEDYR